MRQEKIKFFKNIAAFLIILIIFILIINAAYVNLVLTKKTFYRKETIYQDYISKLPEKKFDYVFFGSSHTFHDVNPDYINNSYNYATGAENYIKTYYKLRKMLEKDHVKIKAALFELDPHTFSTRLTDQTNLFSELELYSKFVSFSEIKKVRKESIFRLWLEAKVPFIGKGKEFGVLITNPYLADVHSNGWLRNTANFSISNKSESAIENYNSLYVGQERISNISFEYFIKTIELAKANNISIIFIRYPHTKEYQDEMLKHNLTNEEYYNYIFTNVNKTISSYSFLDNYNLFPEKDYLFGDPEHLNFVGSEIFSKKLDLDLKNINSTN